MNVVRKDATITNTASDDDFPGTFEVILSAPTLDRDGDTLGTDEWKTPLPDHITFDQDHGMSVATTVGSGTPAIAADGTLRVSGTYSSLDRAQEVRTLVKEGHIRTTSVAFMTEKSTAKDGRATVTRELLNGAFVAVPSNREALVLASKGLKAGARNNASDAESIQSIHDASTDLGADCTSSAKAPARKPRTKSIVGSLEATQDRVSDAIEDAYPGLYPWLRGTLPLDDANGTAVFDLYSPDGCERQTFRQTYSDDGTLVTLNDDATPVDIMEVVTPDADAAIDPNLAKSAPTADVKSTVTAPSAAAADEKSAADEAERLVLEMQVAAEFAV